MMWLQKIRAFVSELDQGEFRKLMMVYLAAFAACSGMLLFFYFSQEVGLKDKIRQLNKSRKTVQKVLTDYQKVAQQKEAVVKLLSEDENFYLQQFVQTTLKTVGITGSTVGKVASQSLKNGYTEESVSVLLAGINTQQLCQLLQSIEQASRGSVKNVTINREEGATDINVSMTVATLKSNGG